MVRAVASPMRSDEPRVRTPLIERVVALVIPESETLPVTAAVPVPRFPATEPPERV